MKRVEEIAPPLAREFHKRRAPSSLKRLITFASAIALSGLALVADSRGINFETTQEYQPGTIQNQPDGMPPPEGWGGSSPGPILINPAIDQEVVAFWPGRPASFGNQSWRISNFFASGSFGDMPFSPSLKNEAGEENAQESLHSNGMRQNQFEVQWAFTSADPARSNPASLESNSRITVSPDRGDGARMSFIRLEDHPYGIDVRFADYQDNKPRGRYGSPVTAAPGCGEEDDFTDILVATVSRNKAHTVKLAIGFVDGPHNDVVKVYVDGALRHVGTTWEDYYRWCAESGGGTGNPAIDQSRTVDSMLFRISGTPRPDNKGKGFLIDNLFYSSSRSEDRCFGRRAHGDDDVDDGHSGRGRSRFHKEGCDKHDDDHVEHDDDQHGHHFRSTSVNSAEYDTAGEGRSVTMTGTGLDNGLPVGFTLIVVDYDGVIPATYSLILTNGYAFVGQFAGGSVSVQ